MSGAGGSTHERAVSAHVEALAAAVDAALGAEDAEERRLAAGRLAEIEPAPSARLLLRALGDVDWRVRKEAARAGQDLLAAAAARGDRPGEDLLVAALLEVLAPGDNVGLRNAAIDVLAGHGGVTIPALAGALRRLDADGRKLAVEALGRTREAAALGPLEEALSDPEDNVRHAAMEAIAAIGVVARAQVVAILTRALGDGDRFVQLTALHGLTALEAAIPWALLSPLVEDSMLRPVALSAAALAESPEAPPALVRALATARGSAFAQIVGALARLLDGPLEPHVMVALRASGPEVAARLVRAASDPARVDMAAASEPPSWRGPGSTPLRLRGMALVLAGLANALGAETAAIDALAEPALAEPAQRALLSLGEPALPAVIARLAEAGVAGAIEPEQAAALIDVAVAIGGADGRHAAALLAATRGAVTSPSTLVAAAALYALARLGLEEDLRLVADQTISAALPTARAAEGALGALSERHPAAALALAREMMHAPALYLPAAIMIEALGAPLTASAAPRLALGAEELSFLARAAAAGDVRARCAAVSAAATLAGPAALDILSAALADEEREVQLAAARALGRLRAALDPAAAPASASSRTAELFELVRRSGDTELLLAADPSAAGDALGPLSDAELHGWTGGPASL